MLGFNKSGKFKILFSYRLLIILEIVTSMVVHETPLVFKEISQSINLLFLLSANKLKCDKKCIPNIGLLTSVIIKTN